MTVKKTLITWEELKDRDFESLLGVVEMEIKHIEGMVEAQSRVNMPIVKPIQDYMIRHAENQIMTMRAVMFTQEMIGALRDGLCELEIYIDDMAIRLSRIEKGLSMLDENR